MCVSDSHQSELHLTAFPIKAKYFYTSSVVASRHSSALEDEQLPVNAEGGVRLSHEASSHLMKRLIDHALFTSKTSPVAAGPRLITFQTDMGSRVEWHKDPSLTHPALNEFVRSLFVGVKDKTVPVQRVVSWIEVQDATVADLQLPHPKKFAFVLKKQLITKSWFMPEPTKDNLDNRELTARYTNRELVRVNFQHYHTSGGRHQPVLDLRCDRASYFNNPSARFSFNSIAPPVKRDESTLRDLIRFIIFPAQELRRFLAAETQSYSVSVVNDLPVNIEESIFRPVQDPEALIVFSRDQLRLKPNLECGILGHIKLTQLAFSMQRCLTDAAVERLVAKAGLESPPTKSQMGALLRDHNLRLIASYAAALGTKVHVGSQTTGFRHLDVETKFARVANSWGSRSDEVVLDRIQSMSNQQIEAVTIKVREPVQRRDLYAIEFYAYDMPKRRAELKNFGSEYDVLRQKISGSGAPLPSLDQKLTELSRSIAVTVTVCRRVLTNNFGCSSVSDLRNKVRRDFGSDVQGFALSMMDSAFEVSGLYYWSDPSRWGPLAFATPAGLRQMYSNFVDARSLSGNIEGDIGEERWAFLASLPAALSARDPAAIRRIKKEFENPVTIRRNKSKNIAKSHRATIMCVPEVTVAALLHWYFFPTESTEDFIRDSEFIPDDHKNAYLQDYGYVDANGTRRLMEQLLGDVKRCCKSTFGIDLPVQRVQHQKVFENRDGALNGTRVRLKDFSYAEAEEKLVAASNVPAPRLANKDPFFLVFKAACSASTVKSVRAQLTRTV